jgi:hypothetical protein
VKTETKELIAKVSAGIVCLWLDRKNNEIHASVSACFASYVNRVLNYTGASRNEAIAKLHTMDADIARWLSPLGYRIVKRGRHWMNEFVPSLIPKELASV